ncbi:MAG: ASCH domain-containing protein [Nitratireductor sp.]|nr:ASCH domain-containing protein [Nitratireductor sp.]
MKAISLWQPWASLIAAGVKPYETRHWSPPRELIGQRIAIHAAKRVDRDAAGLATDIMFGQHPGNHLGSGFELADKIAATFLDCPPDLFTKFGDAVMPAGCVVCTAVLDAAFQLGPQAEGTAFPAARVVRSLTSRPMPDCFTVRLDDYGDYSPGRWAWLLREVSVVMPPAPVTGRQGFFDLPQGWLTDDYHLERAGE